jgi:hypothetical protein
MYAWPVPPRHWTWCWSPSPNGSGCRWGLSIDSLRCYTIADSLPTVSRQPSKQPSKLDLGQLADWQQDGWPNPQRQSLPSTLLSCNVSSMTVLGPPRRQRAALHSGGELPFCLSAFHHPPFHHPPCTSARTRSRLSLRQQQMSRLSLRWQQIRRAHGRQYVFKSPALEHSRCQRCW